MPISILVVDDNSIMRKILIKTLSICGINLGAIHEASDGLQALEVLSQQEIDLMLLDVNMPIMNGEETLRRLRQQPATAALPVIVVSTEGSETRIAVLQHLGAAFLHKPFSPEQLRQIVLNTMGVSSEPDLERPSFTSHSPDF